MHTKKIQKVNFTVPMQKGSWQRKDHWEISLWVLCQGCWDNHRRVLYRRLIIQWSRMLCSSLRCSSRQWCSKGCSQTCNHPTCNQAWWCKEWCRNRLCLDNPECQYQEWCLHSKCYTNQEWWIWCPCLRKYLRRCLHRCRLHQCQVCPKWWYRIYQHLECQTCRGCKICRICRTCRICKCKCHLCFRCRICRANHKCQCQVNLKCQCQDSHLCLKFLIFHCHRYHRFLN